MEAQVRRLTDQTLKDFITRISSGSTPDTKRSDEYYTDAHNGVSFIRVQNLSPEGLRLDDCKYITLDTHNELLKRSQVSGGDLLVKITGVGRMAVSSVAPYGFEGNINQHIAAIKTENYQTCEVLAAFLNSDIGEKLASRRSTGGTRPALDYRALKSIPIIYKPEIVEMMQSAYAQKRQKDQQADALLDSIDDYVLSELGVKLPKPHNNRIENRIFTTTFSDVSGRRLDPEVYYQVYSLHTKSYPMEGLQDCVLINPPTSFCGHELNESITFVPMEKISDKYGEADLSLCKELREAQGYTKFRENDLIWAKITPCMENGKSAIVANLKGGIGVGSTEFHVFRALEGINIRYIHALLRLKSLREHAVLHFTGSAGQQRVSSEFFKNLIIPKPPIEKQTQIANHIAEIRTQAKQLQQEANAIVETAKREVERILLERASD